MKIKEGFGMRQIAGEWVVVPMDADLEFNGMITLNDTAATMWQCLQEDVQLQDLTNALLAEYDVDEARAAACAANFVEKLKELDLLA